MKKKLIFFILSMLVSSHALSVMLYRRAPGTVGKTWYHRVSDSLIIGSSTLGIFTSLNALASESKDVTIRRASFSLIGLSLLGMGGGAPVSIVPLGSGLSCRFSGSDLEKASGLSTEISPESEEVTADHRLSVVRETLLQDAVIFHEQHLRQTTTIDASSQSPEAESPSSILLEPGEYLFQAILADDNYYLEELTQFRSVGIMPHRVYILLDKEGRWSFFSSDQNGETRFCRLIEKTKQAS